MSKGINYQKQILNTLNYFIQFDYPLNFRQLWQHFPIQISQKKLKNIITDLVKNKKIVCVNNFYFIKNKKNLSKIRQQRQKISLQKKQQANDFIKFAKKCRFIQAVGITGSLAANNAQESDDLDFLIVTQKNKLWLTRMMVLIFSMLKKRRPNLGVNIKDAWDFNLWLEEDALFLDVKRQTIYEAYEILQIDWLVDKNNISEKIKQQNIWLKIFLPNLKIKKAKFVTEKTGSSILNFLAFFIQKYYRQIRYGEHQVIKNQAFFHQNSTKEKILIKQKES